MTLRTGVVETVSAPLQPLPIVPGPKLAPFTLAANVDIEFVHPLGNAKNKDGHVWKVIIDGRVFALKMFRFRTWEGLATSHGKHADPLSTEEAYLGYYDPFSCECRAYGRLRQEQRVDLAVFAHGYVLLTPEQEYTITSLIEDDSTEWSAKKDLPLDGRDLWGRLERHRNQPIRAIVKDFIEDPEAFSESQVGQLWTDLKDLHSLGILVRDIHLGNYRGGKLVDFSLAWTMYHPGLDRVEQDMLHEFRLGEIIDLDQVLYDWWNRHPTAEIAIPEELTSLSSGDRAGELDIDPRGYDWRKWEPDAAKADKYIEDLYY